MKVGSQSIPPSYLKHGITLRTVLMVMVISSPVIMLVNPALLAATSLGGADVATYAPSTISQGGSDFTAQAPLLGPATFRSTDLVSSTAIYEIQFITTTTGVIDKIDITFPAGTGVALAGIIERVGIGPGALTKSGSTVTFDLHSPVSIPAGTFIRLEMVDISNPPGPANYKISVTTKDSSNMPIDGPSLSPAYTIRQVSTGMIANNAITTPKIADFAVISSKLQVGSVTDSKLDAGAVSTSKIEDGAVTSTKPAESFMKRVTVLDNAAGNAVGWNPGGLNNFFISEPDMSGNPNNPFFIVTVTGPNYVSNGNWGCDPVGRDNLDPAKFVIFCDSNPIDGSELHYVVGNLPAHTVQ